MLVKIFKLPVYANFKFDLPQAAIIFRESIISVVPFWATCKAPITKRKKEKKASNQVEDQTSDLSFCSLAGYHLSHLLDPKLS